MTNQPQLNISPNDTTPIVCEECGHECFRPVVLLRKVSRFISPDGQEHIIPLDSMECSKCNHVNQEFYPVPKIETENGKDRNTSSKNEEGSRNSSGE